MKYPELDHDARLAVWRRFLALAGHKVVEKAAEKDDDAAAAAAAFHESDLVELAEKPFNGTSLLCVILTRCSSLIDAVAVYLMLRANGEELSQDGAGFGSFDVRQFVELLYRVYFLC